MDTLISTMDVFNTIDFLTKSNIGALCQGQGGEGGALSCAMQLPHSPSHFNPVHITGAAHNICAAYGKLR